MKRVNLDNYGKLADTVSMILNGADLRCASANELDRIEEIALDHNDVPVLYALTPLTDEPISDEDLAAWEVSHDHVYGVKGMKKDGFYIVDWAGNVKFNGKTFDSFDDASSFLCTKFKSDEDLGEFEIMCKACEGVKS